MNSKSRSRDTSFLTVFVYRDRNIQWAIFRFFGPLAEVHLTPLINFKKIYNQSVVCIFFQRLLSSRDALRSFAMFFHGCHSLQVQFLIDVRRNMAASGAAAI